MTVKELILELQKENPDAQVVCNDGPIYFLEAKPGYYDGHTPMLIHDETKKPYYSIAGFKWDSGQEKVVIQSMSLETCLWHCMSPEKIDEFVIEGDSRYIEYAVKAKERIKEKLIKILKDSGKL